MSNNYVDGKPQDCRYCYWYSKKGCLLEVCYYERPKIKKRKLKPKPKNKCTGCPYGKHSPCIGWCTKEILRIIGRGCFT